MSSPGDLPGLSARRFRLSTLAIGGFLAAAILMTLAGTARVRGRLFDSEPHAWLSAHFATMGRAFVDQGIGASHGVPIQNNPPLGRQPDAYIHWPPLFPITLAVWFQMFGVSEATGRGLMLLLLLGCGLALFALVRSVATPRAAMLAAFAWLVLPVTVTYGRTVLHLPLAVLFQILAVLAFVETARGERGSKTWAIAGMAAMGMAVLTSWEPILAAAGLLLVSMLLRSRVGMRLALGYLVVAAAAAAMVILVYVLVYPFLFADLWRTMLFRLGLGFQPGALPLHALVNESEYLKGRMSLPMVIAVLVARHFDLGAPSLIAMAGVIGGVVRAKTEQARRLALAAAGLFAPWVLWAVLMSHHAVFHEYELLVAAPFAAAALGIGLTAVIDYLERAPHGSIERSLAWLGFLVVPAVLLGIAAQQWRSEVLRAAPPSGLVEYAHDIEAGTPADAVVLVPASSMVPVFYARRHLIRGIEDDAVLERAERALPGVFPGSPIYLALRPGEEKAFVSSLRTHPVVRRTPSVVLLSLGVAQEAGRPGSN